MKGKPERNAPVKIFFAIAACAALLIFITVYAFTAHASRVTATLPNVSLEWVGQVGGGVSINAVAVQGAYAYLGGDTGLVVLDISDPTHPTAVGQTTTPMSSTIHSVAISGTNAYVLDCCVLRVINVADPAHPVEVGAYLSEGGIGGSVAVAGDYAYLAGWGLWIINVADPAHPAKVGFHPMPATAYGVAVAGSYADVTMMSQLRIYDVSDPANPVFFYEHSTYPTPGFALGVAVSGTYAYVGTDLGDNTSGGLQIINVISPTHLTGAGFCALPGPAYGVAVAGNYAYVADGLTGGLRGVNVSNPAHPTASGYYITSGRAQGVAVMGSYAYVADIDDGLRAIRVSDPAHLTEVGAYAPPGYGWRVAVKGGNAYVTDHDGRDLHVISVTNHTAPVQVSLFKTAGIARDVVVSGTYAYVADDDSGLRVVNVANPAHLFEVGSYDSPGQAWGVALMGSYAYVADGPSGLRVVRVSNPAHPSSVGAYDTPGFAQGVAVAGNYAYIADGEEGGLRIVRISDPAHPAAVGFYDTPGCAQHVAVSGHYAYVADCGCLRIVNVADPAHPAEVGVLPGSNVTFVGDYAYTGGGVQVLNISDPAHPVKVGEYAGGAISVAVDESYAYLAGYYGLLILRHSLVWPPVAAFSASPRSGPVPLTVTFTDQSSGDYTGSLLDFGDGVTSTLASLTHTYSAVGVYTVTLTINGPGGSDTLTRADYIRAYLPQPILTAPVCGTTHQTDPIIRGLAPSGFVITLYDDGTLLTTTTTLNSTFAMTPSLAAGRHVLTATATNAIGTGLASRPLTLTVSPTLIYDPAGVTFAYAAAGGDLVQHPRDASACANPDDWQVWLRSAYTTTVTVPVSYTASAAVTVTLGAQTIPLIPGTGQTFTGIIVPPLAGGALVISVTADGGNNLLTGSALIDLDSIVFDKAGGVTQTLAGITVTCEYSDTAAGDWMTWTAWAYDQVNPQVTGEDGYYSFFVPPGTYQIQARHPDYWPYMSQPIEIVDAPARLNIPLALVRRVYLPIVFRH